MNYLSYVLGTVAILATWLATLAVFTNQLLIAIVTVVLMAGLIGLLLWFNRDGDVSTP